MTDGIVGGIDRDDPFYDCVLALFSNSKERLGSAILIAPTIALSIRHCFINGQPEMNVRSTISRKTAAVERIVFRNEGEYRFGAGSVYPALRAFSECSDEIVILELATPLDGPFPALSVLDAAFLGTLRVACEDTLSSPHPHVRTARVASIGESCEGVLAVKEAQPGSGFPMESGAPAFVLSDHGALNVVAIQSGSDDGERLDIRPGGEGRQGRPFPQAKAYATFVKLDEKTLTWIDRTLTPAPAVALRAAASSAVADPNTPTPFRLFRKADSHPHSDDCLLTMPDLSLFGTGMQWDLDWGYGPDLIFAGGDLVFTSQLAGGNGIHMSLTKGGVVKLDMDLQIGGIGGRHWLKGTAQFQVNMVDKTFYIYLFRTTSPDAWSRIRLEAFDLDGGALGQLPENCVVAAGCDPLLPELRIARPFLANVGPRQDDVGSGHEHH